MAIAKKRSFIRKTRKVLNEINSNNFDAFRKSIKQDGLSKTLGKVRDRVVGRQTSEYADVEGMCARYAAIPIEKNRASVDVSENPVVSVVIPVYNNFKLTYDCILSIIDSGTKTPLEIIIGDDCSTDDTRNFPEYISGVKVVTTPQNYGFTLNCNYAAQSCRGKYIFFLNNDTLVLNDWLDSLVEQMEADEKIGLAGSKLLYPDGSLQEAGGILWKDGSAWNYGNGQSPFSSEFNYVHDVDYVSGAAILVRHDLFKEIGGFDKIYAPAYCEDSDLAFEIRKRGFRTMYNPFSVIIHFEGMSNGKRVDAGLKQYQVRNNERFHEKWKDVLETEHFANGEHVSQAKDRSRFRKTILFIDDDVPRFDDNAGHRTTYSYVKLLAEMGYHIVFMPDSFRYDERYVPIYQRMGVEVLYGRKYQMGWDDWILDNADYIDHVMLFRPECARKYMRFIRENTSAVIHYNVADLHYLRLVREYEVTRNKTFLKQSERSKQEEYGFMRVADETITVSSEEQGMIIGEDSGITCRVLPIFTYGEFENTHDYTDSRDILFVGGFSHRPNVDAMVWFIDTIFPEVCSRLSDVRLHIVGSKVPTELSSRASDRVIFEGRLSDEELLELYDRTSVCIVPLRYGAGVKGKVVEAMKMGIPVVSTGIGLEGLSDVDQVLTPSDSVEAFVAEICRLYSDRGAAEKMAESCVGYIRRHYSEDVLREQFYDMFGPLCRKLAT